MTLDCHATVSWDRGRDGLPLMTHVGGVILAGTGQLPASYRTALEALERYLNYFGRGAAGVRFTGTSSTCSNRARRTEPRSARSSGKTPWSSSRRSS
jgi:hypothetical protein